MKYLLLYREYDTFTEVLFKTKEEVLTFLEKNSHRMYDYKAFTIHNNEIVKLKTINKMELLQ